MHELLDLLRAGENEYIGIGNEYPWGGLFGGHIVAQALRAAGLTVAKGLVPHSLRAYFMRAGDIKEVVRYEVDQLRDGRGFATRRVAAYQPGGAILNLEASFHSGEESLDISPIPMATNVPPPDACRSDSWSKIFSRNWVYNDKVGDVSPRDGSGRTLAWLQVVHDCGDDPLVQACALAYVSDSVPSEAAIKTNPKFNAIAQSGVEPFNISLDHAMWFHRPTRIEQWHLADFTCHSFTQNRGLTIGHIHDLNGSHICTVVQEVLVREPRT